ncbi:MAG: toxin-activating lysine-acyltransferase [Hyphomicrobiaceae bacterium]
MFFGSKKNNQAKAAEPPKTAAPVPASTPEVAAQAAPPVATQPQPAPDTTIEKVAASAEPAGLSEEELKKRAAASKLVSASFGEIVSVLMRSEHYKSYTLQDLEWLVVPAVLSNQFLLAEARAKGNGFTAPVGVVLWANVSADVDQRLTANVAQPIRLKPEEWRSGDIPWLVDAVGPPKLIGGMLQQLHAKIFKGRQVKLRTQGPDGKPVVRVMELKPQVAAS